MIRILSSVTSYVVAYVLYNDRYLYTQKNRATTYQDGRILNKFNILHTVY
jgi:hypothetical protein